MLCHSNKHKGQVKPEGNNILLTHFKSIVHFYTPQKRQKTRGFPTFSGDIKMKNRSKIG